MAAFKTHNFLPEVFRTDTNKKFLGATLDQLFSEPNFKKVSGYIGRTFAPTYKTGDGYVSEASADRQHYQLEPGVVVTNPVTETTEFYASYPDIVNQIAYHGGNTTDHSRLFAGDVYSYSGMIDLDKFVNFSQYHWLPNGPDAVTVSANGIPMEYTWDVHLNQANDSFYFGSTQNLNQEITLAYGGTYTFNTNGSPFWIQSQPGVHGLDPFRTNISTRNVLGVTNNGASSGAITFKVPQVDTQNKFVMMPTVASIDYATVLAYKDLQGIDVTAFTQLTNGLDGPTSNLHNKTVIFVGTSYTNADWTVGTMVPQSLRTAVWLITVVNGVISLTPSTDIGVNEKVYVKSGQQNATKEYYVEFDASLIEVPQITSTLDTLYYQSSTVPSAVGVIKLKQPVTTILDPHNDIEGKSSYTSPNGVVFTNGLKVTFDSSAVSPYAENTYYVSGVGSSIKLIPITSMIAVETWDSSTVYELAQGSGYAVNDILTVVGGEYTTPATLRVTSVDASGAVTAFAVLRGGDYSVLPQNPVTVTGGTGVGVKFNLALQPSNHDYLTINRASVDMNAWSRSNRWFHVDVIKYAASRNGKTVLLDQNDTARRPIVEIHQNVKLFNNGTVAKLPVDVLDTVVTNAFTQVEAAPTNNAFTLTVVTSNGTVTLTNGDRVIFSSDSSLNVRNRIYNFSIVDVSSDPSIQSYIGTLVLADDSAITTNNVVIARNSLVHNYWFDGQSWIPSQQKVKSNQAPKFDVFDVNGISFGDKSFYSNSNFAGTTVFTYKTGTGTPDAVLGFPLTYRSFNNVGDIQFVNAFDTDTFDYLIGPVTHTLSVNTGLMRLYKTVDTFEEANGWSVTTEPTKQYQLISHIADGVNNMFEVDILPEASSTVPNIKVFVNSKPISKNMFGLTAVGVRYAVVVDITLLSANDTVDILIYSPSVSKMGFYNVPSNIDNNAGNANFSTLTLGQMRNHLVSLSDNSLQVEGSVPGASNLRDIDIKMQCGSILKHAAPMHYSGLFLVDKQMNFVESIKLAQREYSKFKNRFTEIASTIEVDVNDISGTVDRILKQINGIKNSSFPWYYSDMVPYGDAKTVLPDYVILDPRVKSYQLTQSFDDTVLSNTSVMIYVTRTVNGVTTKKLLAKDRDYTFDKGIPSFTLSPDFALVYNDILSVVEYHNTDGNFIPETPTKLGLHPKFVPTIYIDDTYATPINVIQGHDGSLTPAFNDYRDDLILELELRIFNNIKAAYSAEKFKSIIPGKFRVTDYSIDEFNTVLSTSFLSWAGANRVDFTTNKFFSSSNPWTWNYKNFKDTITGEFLPGSWRAIFMYLYDTMRPHTHPWEMLGFSNKPDWWADRYGPAPYTGGNLTLWTDLSLGYIHAGPRAGIDPTYARPGLLKVIPVDDSGNLLSPEKFAVLDFDSTHADSSFAVGDVGPVEAAWRKSSDYAFALQIAYALTKPAAYFSQCANVDRFSVHAGIGQYVNNVTLQHTTQTQIEVNGDNTTAGIVRTAGYVNWVADYLKNLGIGNPQTKIKDSLKNMTVQLNYKVAGYTDKKFVKFLAEQGSPSSTNNSIVIPDENYKVILNKSVPLDKLVYSAVIVEKSANGYTVSGYDLNNPYFSIVPSQHTNNAYEIKAGVKTGIIYKDYLPVVDKVNYGFEFTSDQQVVDFLVSYQRALQSQGFLFIDNDTDLMSKKDWVLSAKEFLTWSQQGWAPGNVIVLSPTGNKLKVSLTDAVIDEITNTPNGTKLLDPNFATIKNTNFTVVRTDNNFSVTRTDNGTIALAVLSAVQYEHVVIFDNTTVFNDIIYSADTGNRQYRLKFVGFKTSDWTGVLNPPGFVYNSNNYDQWTPGADYRKGQLVVYKSLYYVALDNIVGSVEFDPSKWKLIDQSQLKSGLLPSFANNAAMFETIYDIDNQPFNDAINFYSNGLIGFRERSYLTDLLMDAETQVKFYQGYIKQKGTINAIEALSAAEINGSPTSIEVFEEWAVRVGEYGASDSNQYAEVILDDSVATSNPVALQMLAASETAQDGAVAYYPSDLYKASKNNTPTMFDVYATNADKPSLPVAGYPRIDDVDATIFDLTNYRDLSSTLSNIGTGYTIWTAKDFEGKWNVFRVSETGVTVTSIAYAMDNVATVTTSQSHLLEVGDIIAIKGFSYEIDDTFTTFDGFYQVLDVIDTLHFSIALTFGYEALQKALVIDNEAILFKLSSSRLPNVGAISQNAPLFGWTKDDNIWVDNASAAGWGVYRRSEPWKNYNTTTLNASEYVLNDEFGSVIKVAKNQQFMYASAPNNGTGRVASFVRQAAGTYAENASWVQHSSYTVSSNDVTGFGSSMDLNDRALVVGASASHSSSGYVYVYKIDNSAGITLIQAIACEQLTSNAKFGYSICSSTDGNWLYISAPGQLNGGNVYVYAWEDRSVTYPNTIITTRTVGPFALNEITRPEEILVKGESVYIPYVDYIVTGASITFTSPLQEDVQIAYVSNYKYHGVLTASDITAGDNFGVSISCDSFGRELFVGSNNATVNSKSKSGATYVFARKIENFVSYGTTDTFVTRRPVLEHNKVLLDNVVQNTPAQYNRYGTKVQLTTNPPAGSIVTIETNQFDQIAKLSSNETINQHAGTVVVCSTSGESVYVSAPDYTDSLYASGAVYKYSNPAKVYGRIEGTVLNPTVTPGTGIQINGIDVVFSSTTLASVVESINTSGIPGVEASISPTSTLVITSKTIAKNSFTVTPGIGDAFTVLGLESFVHVQTIKHPHSSSNEYFGTAISISADDHTLAIASKGTSSVKDVGFDGGVTVFDSGSTAFITTTANTGAVYVYDLIDNFASTISNPSKFEFTQTVTPDKAKPMMKFGSSIASVNNSLYIGASGSDVLDINGNVIVPSGGTLMEFVNATASHGWHLVRTQAPVADYASISKSFIYNKNTQNIIARLDVFDPAKGKILGIADQDLDFKSESDPATYNNSASSYFTPQSNYSDDYNWSHLQVGKTWWDLSQLRYITYDQGELTYKNKHWGAVFPGSVFKVYEWVESDYLPSQYIASGGNGIPKYPNNEFYVTHAYVDSSTGTVKSKFYYWVSEKTTVDVTKTNRTNSAYAIQQILSNPKDQGVPYIAALDLNAVALFNVNPYLVGRSIVLHIDHTPVQNTNIIHTEYELIKENPNSVLPKRIVDKLQDSLSGVNFAGHIVPDPKLGVAERYGIEIRPRQTMFVDRLTALSNFVNYANAVFAQYPISDLRNISRMFTGEAIPPAGTGAYDLVIESKLELSYISSDTLNNGTKVLVTSDSDNDGLWTIYKWVAVESAWVLDRIQSYQTGLYIEYADWYASTYDKTITPTYSVSNYPAVARLHLLPNDTVKVLDDGHGKFAIYQLSSANTLDKVASESGTIRIRPTLYDLQLGNMGFDNDNFDTIRFDQNPILETRDIFSAITEDIFVADLQIEFNKLFFSLVNYIFTEQVAPDWIFKTSFMSIVHKIRDLAQYPSYVKDNQTYYEDYINEVKPYRSIIREYLPTQSAKDYLYSGVTDFDLPSYYDEVTGTYRSPDYTQASDADLLNTDPQYKDWNNNHAYKVVDISIASGGENYSVIPTITITGGGGTGAEAKVTSLTRGVITGVMIVSPGTGYTSTPTITVNGNGIGAVLVPILRNEFAASASYNTVRNITTEIKFDRVLDSNATGHISTITNVVKWEPNTEYHATLGSSSSSSVQQYLWQDDVGNYILGGTSTGELVQMSMSTAVDTKPTIWLESGQLVSYNGSIYLPKAAEASAPHSAISNEWVTSDGFVVVDNNFRIMEFAVQVNDSLDTFDYSKFVKLDQGNILLTNNERIAGLYSPSVGMPSASISQLVNGVEYPGVQITSPQYSSSSLRDSWVDNNGNFIQFQDNFIDIGSVEFTYFKATPAKTIQRDWVDNINESVAVELWQSTNDIVMFTDLRIDWNTGLYIADGSEPWLSSNSINKLRLVTINDAAPQDPALQIDSTITSYYSDTLLGTRPEDILIDGGGYYDTFNSHSTAEMLPGRIFETLDIQVLQANTKGFDTDVFTITNVTIQDPGFGYDDAESLALKIAQGVDVSGITLVNVAVDGIANANITPVLAANGAITSLTINNGGRGLTGNANPIITITGSNIAPAQSHAIISQNTYDLVGWRNFRDMNGEVSYTRIADSNTTALVQDLLLTDTTIRVNDIKTLSYPSIEFNTPGRIFINGELITFYGFDEATNTLTQIRRASYGTGAPAIHHAGTPVVDGGAISTIPNTSYVPEVPSVGAPETFTGDNVTNVFTTTNISTLYPSSVMVTVGGSRATNYIVTSLAPVQVTFVQIGTDPGVPGFINAAPPAGVEVSIAAAVEGIWDNVIGSTAQPITFNGANWEVLEMDNVTPQSDPALVALGFSWQGGVLSNTYVQTASPDSGAVTDGTGLMGSTTVQAMFIKGQTVVS